MKSTYLAVILAMTVNWNPALSANADETYNVDNTRQNVRDRNSLNPTAQDQSNRKCDIKVVARLRREIMRTNGLSTNAQNVKIISEGNYIILRGPVDSDSEKNVLNDLARKCCGANVRNELEVKK